MSKLIDRTIFISPFIALTTKINFVVLPPSQFVLPSTFYRFPTVLHKYVLYNPTDSRAAASACPDFGAYLDALPAILSVAISVIPGRY